MMVSFVFDHREGEMAATFANACKEEWHLIKDTLSANIIG
jgi:hypothetical protein